MVVYFTCDEWMNEWMNQSINQSINQLINQSINQSKKYFWSHSMQLYALTEWQNILLVY